MTQCKYFKDCPVNCSTDGNFNRPMSIIHYYHRTYCHGAPYTCARYKVRGTGGRDKVPSDLLPYQHERANQIINNEY
jgi:hypothetical protein